MFRITFYKHGISLYILPCNLLFSFSDVPRVSFLTRIQSQTTFLLMAVSCSTRECSVIFNQSPTEGYLSCLQVVAHTNSAEFTYLYTFLCILEQVLLWHKFIQVELLGQRVFHFTFL